MGDIGTALRETPAERTLVAACDTPCLTREWLRGLLGRVAGEVVVPRATDGRVRPLIAVWHNSAVLTVRTAVLAGSHRMRDAVRSVDCRWIDLGDANLVANVNTPGDWVRLGV